MALSPNARMMLLDIAQGRKKKTEEEKRNERYATTDDAEVRASLQAQNILAADTQEQKAKTNTVQTALQRYYDALQQKELADEDIGRVVSDYAQEMNSIRANTPMQTADTYNPSKATARRNYEAMVHATPEAQKVTAWRDNRIGKIKAENNYSQLLQQLREGKQQNPEIAQHEEIAKNTKSTRVNVVNPFGDVEELKKMRDQLEKKYQTYANKPGREYRAQQNRAAVEELNRQIEMMENPQVALDNVNNQLKLLNQMQNESQGYYDGLGLDQDIKDMERQGTLLEGYINSKAPNVTGRDATMRAMAVTAGEDPNAKKSTMDQWLAVYDANQLADISNFLPEGKTLEDYTVNQDWNGVFNRTTRDAVEWVTMTDDERKTYNDLTGEEREAFMNALRPEVNERIAERQTEYNTAFAEEYPVIANIASVGAEVVKPAGSVYAIAQGLKGEDIDPNSRWFNADRMQSTVRESTKQMIDEKIQNPTWRTLATGAYDIIMGIADNVTRAAFTKWMGAKGSTAAMGFGVLGGSARESVENGANSRQALLKASVDSLVEVVTEYLPTARLFGALDGAGDKTIKQVLKSIAAGMAEEGVGEGMSSLLSAIADKAILDNVSDYDMMRQNYMMRGMNAEEATKAVFADILKEAGYSALIGSLTGGIMQGGAEIVGAMNEASNRKALEKFRAEMDAQEQAQQQALEEQEAKRAEVDELQGEIIQQLPTQQKTEVQVQTAEEAKQEPKQLTKQQEQVQQIQQNRAKAKRRMADVEAVQGDEGLRIRKADADVELSDLDAESADAKMLNAAGNMSSDATNDMLSLYDEKGDVTAEQYAKGYEAAYAVGLSGGELSDATGLYMDDLTETQKQSAWLEGVNQRNKQEARVDSLTRRYATEAKLAARVQGKHNGVSLENVTKKLSNQEATMLQLIDQFAKKYGMDVRVFDTLRKGSRTANAYQKKGTNQIYLALDAEGGALSRVASHEMYHFVESFAKDDAKAIREFVLNKLRNQEGYDLEARIDEITERYEKAGVVGFDAESEIVADGMLDIIGTEENLQQLAGQNKNLLQKIKAHLQELMQFIRDALNRSSRYSEEVRALKDDAAYLQEIIDRMDKALKNAQKNYQAQTKITGTAMKNSMVQGYNEALAKANSASDRKKAADTLVQNLGYVTQEKVIDATGDIDGTLDAFRDVLARFAAGEGQLDSLLQKSGLSAISDADMRAAVAFDARAMVSAEEEAEVKYSAKSEGMVEKDKYLDAVVEKWNPEKEKSGRLRMGKINPGSVYEKVGLKPGALYMHQSKAKAALEKHGDHITKDIIKRIPEMLNDPNVITEPIKDGMKNTVNVFVEMEVGGKYPLMIGLVMKPGVTGDYWVDIVRSVELRKDYEKLINQATVLWVNPKTKKEPILAPWLEKLNVLSAASKDGFVRSIAYEPESVNVNVYSLKADESVQAMRNELKELEEEQKKLLQEQGRYKATEEYKRLHPGRFMPKDPAMRKAYEEYMESSGLGEVNKRMDKVRSMISNLESEIANAVLEAGDHARKVARLRNELGEKEMRLQDVTIKLNEMQKEKGYNDIVDAMMAGKANDDAYNQYLESSGMMKLAKEEKQLRAEIADAKRQLEEAQKQTEQQTEKTETHAFRKWFGKSQVVNDDGSPKMVYHGSGAEFDEFSYEFIGKHGSAEGQGFYFTDSVKMASGYTNGYGGKLYAGWLKIENPLSNDKKTMTREKLKKLISMIDEDGDGIISGYAKNISDYGKPSFYQRELETTVNAIYNNHSNDEAMIREIAYTSGGMAYVATYLRKMGYDGYVVKDKYDDATVYVAFESNQFKSVENVGTFDEETGNFYHSLKSDEKTYFDQVTYDKDVRDAGRLIDGLMNARKNAGFQTGEWKGKTGNIAKQILEETGSAYAQNALTGRINKAYEAIDRAGGNREAIMAYCYDIGKKVAENAGEIAEVDPGRQQARDYLRGTKIYLNAEMQREVKATYGSVQAFMRRNFGKAKFTTDKKATGLEEMWSELHDLVPSVFKEDTQLGEMPMIVEAFLESSGKVNRVYYNATEEQIAQDVAMRLFWEYFQMPGTYSHLQEQEKEMVQRISDTMDSLRDTFEQRVQERITQREEREEKVRQRTMLERTVKQLDRKLRKPTKQNHIPEQYRGAVAAALELVNTGGNRKGQEARTARYNALLGEIAKLRENDSDMAHIDPDMEAHIEQLKNEAAGKSIMVMNAEELKTLNDIMRNIQHACVKSDQLLTAGRQTSLRKMASAFHENMETRGDRKVKGNLGTAFEKIGRSMQDAPRFFNELARVGGEGARELWEIIRFDGLDTQIRLVEEAEKKMHEALDGYDYKKMYSENSGNTDFATESGNINLTKGQVMALYLLNKREQARNHIYGVKGEDGGIAQGRVKIGTGKYSESVRPSKVNEMQVKAIIDTLTADEKAVADKMGALLSGWCADLGNEVSMQMYGYKKFTEANYFPIQVWDGRKSVTSGEQFKNDLYQIMNKGFTKELTDKAQAPLVVPDIFDAVTEHVNGMIVYRAWTAPVTDVIKFLNYKYTDETTKTIDGVVQYVDGRNILGSVREDMDRVLGKAAADYMTQLLKDINGRSKNNVEKIWDKGVGVLTRNQKSSAVAANIGTMMKQPFSITRAFDVIPAYYFAGRPIVPTKKRAELIAKYAPIYYWKQQGNFTMDSGKSIQSILMPGLESAKNKFNELAMAGAGYMDNVTWHNIWAASERMVNAKIRSGKESEYAGLQEGTDAYYKKVAEIFNKCVDETQTVDSILHRTEVMRQDSALLKMLTSFMGEPLKTLNMMMDAVDGAKKKDVQSMRRLVRTGAVLGVSVVVQEMVNAMVSTLRNWDDEDRFWEQFKDAFLGEYEEDMTKGEKAKEFLLGSSLGSGLNILTYIPVARDLMETFSGYTVERMDMTLMSELVKAVQQLGSESKGDVKKVTDILGALGNLFGIPAGNIIKESGRIWNYVAQQLEAAGVDTLAMQYAQLKVKKDLGESNLTDYATLILKAEKQGNTDLAKQIRADMLEAGATEKKLDKKLQTLQLADSTGLKASDANYKNTYAVYAQAIMAGDEELQNELLKALNSGGESARTDEDIENGLAKWLAENDERVMKAAKQKMNNDLNYTDVYAKIRADGFSDAVAKKAVTKAYNAIKPEAKEDKAESKEKKNTYVGVYDSADFASVVETKNARDAQKVIEDLRKQGKDDSSIKSSITNYAKDLYKQLMNGTARDKQEAQKLKEMLLRLDLKNKYTEKAIEKWLED